MITHKELIYFTLPAIVLVITYILAWKIGAYWERKAWNRLIDNGILPIPNKTDAKIAFVINPNDKFFPEANQHIWDYCTYLGKYIDKNGTKWDLGVFIEKDGICDASVYGNKGWEYCSGRLYFNDDDGYKNDDKVSEVKRRAKIMNLLTEDHKRK